MTRTWTLEIPQPSQSRDFVIYQCSDSAIHAARYTVYDTVELTFYVHWEGFILFTTKHADWVTIEAWVQEKLERFDEYYMESLL